MCAACAAEYIATFTVLNSIKELNEVFDIYQLRVLAVSGGNKAFSEWMKLYEEYIK